MKSYFLQIKVFEEFSDKANEVKFIQTAFAWNHLKFYPTNCIDNRKSIV